MDVWLAGAIFLIAYGAIATERVDRTLSALLGGLLVVALGIIGQAEALAAIDFNVIFLLAGMMVLAGALGRTGVLEWLAIRAVKASRGHPMRLLVYLALITAVLSAFLDNVTTVVVMAPITLHIAATLGVSPYPYLISQILASNIGGTATLIGDPPNIMIGSAAGLDFGAFLVNLTPLVALILVAFTLTLGLLFGQQLKVPDDRREAVLEMEEARALTDRRLLKRALPIVAATVVALLFHSALGLEAATIALLGATVLMLFGGLDPKEALRDIEWSTLAFFVGLFMLVEGIVHVASWEGSRIPWPKLRAGRARSPRSSSCGSRPWLPRLWTTSPSRRRPSRLCSGWWRMDCRRRRCGGHWLLAPAWGATSPSSGPRPTWWSLTPRRGRDTPSASASSSAMAPSWSGSRW
jgi:Na+/H+ antiporter NhaD/arsenite permease-like protein